MVKNVDQTDYFGFKNIKTLPKKEGTCSNKNREKQLNIKSILIWTLIIVTVCIIISSVCISGYIAWNEFEYNPVWAKLIKTYLAVLFSPVYLSYIFLRSLVFKVPS